MDEKALDAAMDRYAEGEAGAFPLLYDGLEGRLRRYFLRMGASAELAADLAQETFLRMHRARASFARGSAVLPWSYAIGRNVFIDHARSKKRRSAELASGDDERPSPPDPHAATGEDASIAAQLVLVVQRTLAGIPKAQREAFVLVRYEGLSMEQAAEVLGTTKTAVKLRAFRAYEALRAALAEGDRP